MMALGWLRDAQQFLDQNIDIQVGPMDTHAIGDPFPVVSLCHVGITKGWDPFQRHGNFSAIAKNNAHGVWAKRQVGC